ncbi:hypothetical protein GCM10010415_75360 [Streptomyces atrovirens]
MAVGTDRLDDQAVALPADRTTHHRGQPQPDGAGVRGERVGDPPCRLTRRYDHRPQRLPGPGTPFGQEPATAKKEYRRKGFAPFRRDRSL